MTNAKELDSLRVLIGRSQRLGLLGDCYAEIIRLTQATTSLREVEEFVLRQPMFAARVLRLANSAMYAAGARNVGHALAVLGLPQVRSILVAASLQSMTRNPVLRERHFVRRCLVLGVLSHRVAHRVGMADPEAYYVAGLLQDIGYLALSEFMPVELEKVVLASRMMKEEDPAGLSRAYLGFDHEDVGALLADEWNFDHLLKIAIRHHHEPFRAPQEYVPVADVAHTASTIADGLGIPPIVGLPPHRPDPYAVTRLGLTDDDVQQLTDSLRRDPSDVDAALHAEPQRLSS